MHLSLLYRNDHAPRNKNYKNDLIYVTKYSEWILKVIGIWPSQLKGVARFLPKLATILCNLLLLFGILPCALYIVFEAQDVIVQLKLCGLITFCVSALMKHWALTARRPNIQYCIDEMQTDWKQVEFREDRKMMLKYGKVGRNLTVICAGFMYSSGTIYHTILQYAIGTYTDRYNRTIKPLVYPTYSALYNVQNSPQYELVYAAHCMCGFVMYSVTAGACGLAALFVTHACGQIDIVTSRLNDLVDSKRTIGISDIDTGLVNIVEHHLRILRFSAAVETILQEVCFLEFVGSTFLICLLEYYCLIDWEQSNAVGLTTYVMLLISLTFNIFILCYIGELLMNKTGSIGLSCFMINWYHLPTKTIQGIILIIAMSNNPAKISAGRVVDLSLSTFGGVLKTSLAYLSFLRTSVRH